MDWVGNRYGHGDELYRLLLNCDVISSKPGDWTSELWTSNYDLTFFIPENVAWSIQRIAEEGGYHWDCLSPDFASKLTSFCQSIV